jgi:hypothetical protein
MNVERELERFVDSIGEPEPPRDAHRRELRQQVVAVAQTAGRLGLVSQTNRWRSIMNNPLIRWSATAALVLVGVALVAAYAIHAPSTAWADVQKTLNQAQTLLLKVTVYQGGQLRTEETISFLGADRMRVDRPGASAVFDWASGKMLSLVPEQKLALVAHLTGDDKSERENWLARLKEIVGSKGAKELGRDTFEGRPCKGWRVGNDLRTTTVWADEKTAQLVRVEMEMKAGNVRTVFSEFCFNPKLDESNFSLEAPEGYEVLADMTISARDNALGGLLLLLRAWSGGNGGVFPDSLSDTSDWFKAATKYDWSQEKIQDEKKLKSMIGQAFFLLNSNEDWVYRGKGVKRGDAKKAVFWRPVGGGKHQVVYGDLSVRAVDKKDLPRTPSAHEAASPSTSRAKRASKASSSATPAKGDATENLLLLFRVWSGGNGGAFPDALTGVAATADWFKAAAKYDWSKETKDESTLRRMIGEAFFALNAQNDWTYRGKGVKVGDAKTAVFWQLVGAGKYQVIYGDLSVHSSQTEPRP